MMRERMLQTVTAAAAIAAATVVTGQSTTPQTPTKPIQPTQRDNYGQQRDSEQKLSQQVELRRASKCIGAEIRGTDNEKLGDIKDFAVDSRAGKAKFAIISTGGLAGIGDTVRAVPFKALRFTAENAPIRLNITKANFEQAPTIDENAWDRLSNSEFSNSLYKHYNVQHDVDSDAMRDRERDLTPQRTDRDAPGRDARQATAGRFLKCTDVIGMNVDNAQNEDLGEVNDVMLNIRNGQIAYAVLGFGGVLGMGEKLFAVPWQALRFDTQNEQFVLNVEKERLQNAPGFDRNNWPNMSDVRWNQDVHAFYGTEPDWIYGYAETDSPSGGKAMGWNHDSEYNKKFKSGQTQTISGTVQGLDHSRPMANMSEAVILNVRTTEGQTIPVHLGPAWFIDNQSIQFNNGDQVTVSGVRCDIDGKQVVLATEVRSNNTQLTLREQDGHPRWDATKSSSGRAPTDRNPTPR